MATFLWIDWCLIKQSCLKKYIMKMKYYNALDFHIYVKGKLRDFLQICDLLRYLWKYVDKTL